MKEQGITRDILDYGEFDASGSHENSAKADGAKIRDTKVPDVNLASRGSFNVSDVFLSEFGAFPYGKFDRHTDSFAQARKPQDNLEYGEFIGGGSPQAPSHHEPLRGNPPRRHPTQEFSPPLSKTAPSPDARIKPSAKPEESPLADNAVYVKYMRNEGSSAAVSPVPTIADLSTSPKIPNIMEVPPEFSPREFPQVEEVAEDERELPETLELPDDLIEPEEEEIFAEAEELGTEEDEIELPETLELPDDLIESEEEEAASEAEKASLENEIELPETLEIPNDLLESEDKIAEVEEIEAENDIELSETLEIPNDLLEFEEESAETEKIGAGVPVELELPETPEIFNDLLESEEEIAVSEVEEPEVKAKLKLSKTPEIPNNLLEPKEGEAVLESKEPEVEAETEISETLEILNNPIGSEKEEKEAAMEAEDIGAENKIKLSETPEIPNNLLESKEEEDTAEAEEIGTEEDEIEFPETHEIFNNAFETKSYESAVTEEERSALTAEEDTQDDDLGEMVEIPNEFTLMIKENQSPASPSSSYKNEFTVPPYEEIQGKEPENPAVSPNVPFSNSEISKNDTDKELEEADIIPDDEILNDNTNEEDEELGEVAIIPDDFSLLDNEILNDETDEELEEAAFIPEEFSPLNSEILNDNTDEEPEEVAIIPDDFSLLDNEILNDDTNEELEEAAFIPEDFLPLNSEISKNDIDEELGEADIILDDEILKDDINEEDEKLGEAAVIPDNFPLLPPLNSEISKDDTDEEPEEAAVIPNEFPPYNDEIPEDDDLDNDDGGDFAAQYDSMPIGVDLSDDDSELGEMVEIPNEPLVPLNIRLMCLIAALMLPVLGITAATAYYVAVISAARVAEAGNTEINQRAADAAGAMFAAEQAKTTAFLVSLHEELGAMEQFRAFFAANPKTAALAYTGAADNPVFVNKDFFYARGLNAGIAEEALRGMGLKDVVAGNNSSEAVYPTALAGVPLLALRFPHSESRATALFSTEQLLPVFQADGRFSLLIDRNGSPLSYTKNEELLDTLAPYYANIAVGNTARIRADSGAYLASMQQLDGSLGGASVLTLLPESTFLDPLKRALQSSLYLPLVLCFLTLLLVQLIFRNIGGKLRFAASAAETIRLGGSVHLYTPYTDECGAIMRGLNNISRARAEASPFMNKNAARLLDGNAEREYTVCRIRFPLLGGEDAADRLNGFISRIFLCVPITGGAYAEFSETGMTAYWNGGADGAAAAVRTALMIRAALIGVAVPAARIGVASGAIIAAETETEGRLGAAFLGEAVRLADMSARLAEPLGAEIVLTETVKNLVKDNFMTEELPHLEKAYSEKTRLFTVINTRNLEVLERLFADLEQLPETSSGEVRLCLGVGGPQNLAELRRMLGLSPSVVHKIV